MLKLIYMKPFVFFALAITLFSSCKKSHKCTCKKGITGYSFTVETNDLKAAKDSCEILSLRMDKTCTFK